MVTQSVWAGNRCLVSLTISIVAIPSFDATTLVIGVRRCDRSIVFGCDVPTSTIAATFSGLANATRQASAPPSEWPATTHLLTCSVSSRMARTRSSAAFLCRSSGASLYGSRTTTTGCPLSARGRSSGAYASAETPPPTMNTKPERRPEDVGLKVSVSRDPATVTFASLESSTGATPFVRNELSIHPVDTTAHTIKPRRIHQRRRERFCMAVISRLQPIELMSNVRVQRRRSGIGAAIRCNPLLDNFFECCHDLLDVCRQLPPTLDLWPQGQGRRRNQRPV